MDTNLSELIQMIENTREEFLPLIDSTDPAREINPGWTIKDVLGHVATWEIVIHKAIKAFQAGDPPYFLREQDFDQFNKQEVEKRSTSTLDEVIKEWKQVREDLKKVIKKLKEEDLMTEMVLPWGSERTLKELIEIIAEHEEEHLEDVTR